MNIESWIRLKVKNAGAKGTVIGISGGVDSAVVAVLAKNALYDEVVGIILPCFSNENDMKDGVKLCKKFNIMYKIKSLSNVYSTMIANLPTGDATI